MKAKPFCKIFLKINATVAQHNLQKFVKHLKAGGVVGAPAEGVYGYCADPFNGAALNKILTVKQRAGSKGFITLIHGFDQLGLVAAPLTTAQQRLLAQHWPGHVTFILPARPGLPKLLTGGMDTVAVRLPAKNYMQEYLQAWGGPLVSTSANVSGQAPAVTPNGLEESIFCLEHNHPLDGTVSEIIDIRTGVKLR